MKIVYSVGNTKGWGSSLEGMHIFRSLKCSYFNLSLPFKTVKQACEAGL